MNNIDKKACMKRDGIIRYEPDPRPKPITVKIVVRKKDGAKSIQLDSTDEAGK